MGRIHFNQEQAIVFQQARILIESKHPELQTRLQTCQPRQKSNFELHKLGLNNIELSLEKSAKLGPNFGQTRTSVFFKLYLILYSYLLLFGIVILSQACPMRNFFKTRIPINICQQKRVKLQYNLTIFLPFWFLCCFVP